MRTRQWKVMKFISICAALSIATLSVLAATKPSNKWRIKFDGKADADGKIVLRIIPPQGDPQEIEATIPAGTTENGVAALVRDRLKTVLGEAYHVERDDFENVLIKSRGKTPDFGLELASSSITGLKIDFKRE